jgi:antitoxin CcdA
MKRTRVEQIEVVHGLRCDRCGSEARPDEAAFKEFVSIDQVGGYGSVFGDGNRVRLDLCPVCLQALAGEWIRATPRSG